MNDQIIEKVEAKDFLQAWMETVLRRKEELLPIWRKKKEFTQTIKGSEFSVMEEIATKLNLLCYPKDYYSLDAILYKTEDLTPGIKEGTFWFHDIRVAFEHINDFTGRLFHEFSHLLLTQCDLRVLVTYPNSNTSTELEYLHQMISANRNSKLISESESFLMIFGYEDDFIWEALVYKTDGWKTLYGECNNEVEILKKQLERTIKQKERAIKEQEFELASGLRFLQNDLLERIKTLTM